MWWYYNVQLKLAYPKENYIVITFITYLNVIRKWSEGEVIGHGSFGRVLLGFNKNNGEIMAIKQVHLS